MNLLGPILMPLWFFIFMVAAPAFLTLMIFLLLIARAPPQAKTLMKAKFLRKHTLVDVAGGLLDIKAAKRTPTGHMEVSKHEIYNPLKSGNPIITQPYIWRGTGVPAHIVTGRKAVYTSPESLKAMKYVETKDDVDPLLKEFAEKHNLEITVKRDTEGTPVEKEMKQLTSLDKADLEGYFGDAIDVEAEDVLYDKAKREGMQEAGKPPRWLLGIAVLALCLSPIILIIVSTML